MAQDLTDVYSELFHYTTAIGLNGIIRDKNLWATHCRYLNDSSEFISFFASKLPEIIRKVVEETLKELNQDEPIVAHEIARFGGIEELIDATWASIQGLVSQGDWSLIHPYLTSFCGVGKGDIEIAKDGLLSQWRGYGSDGGYAIVFDIKPFVALLNEEFEKYHFAFLRFGDVEYYPDDLEIEYKLPEMQELEGFIKTNISQFIKTGKEEFIKAIALPVAEMASTHKHQGFSEEREVRIIAVPMGAKELDNLDRELYARKQRINKSFYIRNGLFVPHLTLFKDKKLPIKRIIVGPHPDAFKRVESLRMLLEEYEIEAEVTHSNIPYIGK